MSNFVRASKYRHVFVEAPKINESYTGIRQSTAVGEQNYIKGNPLYFAVAVSGGGGPFAVIPYTQLGAVPVNQPIVTGHTGSVLDFDFNPFHDHIVASGAEDTTIKVWGIPEGGLTENLSEPLQDLHGHERKVTLVRFHPTASNVLGSVSGDNNIKLWDIEKGSAINTCTVHEQLIQDIVWDYRGNHYATTCKDKILRIIDARNGIVAHQKVDAHEGSKSSKAVFLGNTDHILTVGFTKQSQRQLKIWDTRNLDTEIKAVEIDQAAGVIMPFYDMESKLLYLAGKGDGNIRYYEIVDETPYIFPINEYRSTVPCKGVAMVPKRGLDVMKCETARLLKLTTTTVEPLSFIVPRKGDFFQEDLYPPTFSGIPSHTADDWFAGSDKEPKLMSLDPAQRQSAPSQQRSPAAVMKSAGQLQKELDQALARIAVLEKRLKDAGLNSS